MALQTTLIILTLATAVLGVVGLFFRMGSQFGSILARLDGMNEGFDAIGRHPRGHQAA